MSAHCLCCRGASLYLSVLQEGILLPAGVCPPVYALQSYNLVCLHLGTFHLPSCPTFLCLHNYFHDFLPFLHLHHHENFHLHQSVHISLIFLAIHLILDCSESPASLLSNKTNLTLIDYLELNLWPILFTLSLFFCIFLTFLAYILTTSTPNCAVLWASCIVSKTRHFEPLSTQMRSFFTLLHNFYFPDFRLFPFLDFFIP